MHNLAQKIINENEDIKKLYKKATLEKDEKVCSVLNEQFLGHLFKIYSTSYLHKSIVLNAREIKRKHLKIYSQEDLILDKLDPEFNEAKIDSIPDKSVNFIEEITVPKDIDFTEIFTDRTLALAINNLTKKQKTILFLRFVKQFEEKEIAKKLRISIQAVNKIKNASLKALKSK
ncbi:sigma factor-like helix-turn-helix DNA-binding protein [Filibacter tadaridae]|uniref:Sigma-70, region 4 n=1 Tax=Filibacter tadaridae TaxID=2483811 RepID=A0A3P5WHR6_9BACL|nr:sigma factor-like helix-turn-helix DNA-binding protein [Filibacter tadaridae]VDC18081.1 Sigma-70, region 4 [Filibacter tadaridae]